MRTRRKAGKAGGLTLDMDMDDLMLALHLVANQDPSIYKNEDTRAFITRVRSWRDAGGPYIEIHQ